QVVLDTDVLIEIFDRNSKEGEKILKKLEAVEVATTSINLHEILYGFNKIGKKIPEEILQLKTFEYNNRDAILSSKFESELEKSGYSTGRFDCMIAAICINRNCSLASFNIKHFGRFKRFGLKLFEV
ncbi:MAG: type II toxin-antitoxin system VapC family toxin, partial [Euryarchaeota archaeon]|nr:type II toxin-antitoxin system VapC family toxin [Euryarchaeota archaeon]